MPKGSAIVIGSGAAGSGAARALAQDDWDVTIVERDKVGGTCLWHGCMPKKALYHAARLRREMADSETFGLACGDPSFDWLGVLAWKWHSQETYAGDQEGILVSRGIRLVKGDARFVSPESVEVAGEQLTADHIVIATGSKPSTPAIPGLDLAATSSGALGFKEPPASLLIVGGGYIGLEFAAIYSAFGSEITVVTSGPRPLEMIDPDTAQVAISRLLKRGVTFHSGCSMRGLEDAPGGVTARFTESDGTGQSGTFERVLVAVGRVPATDTLDLEAAGVETERGRIVHDAYLRTTNPSVWVAGDAAGGMMQTPVASYEGRTVAQSIASGTPVRPDCSTVPTTVFTDPQLAQVGLSEAEADERGIAHRTTLLPFEYLGSAIIEDQRDGLVKFLFAEDDGRLLGAHIAGPTASDLIYAAAIAMRTGATDATIRETLGIHPGYAEVLNWAAG